jgi:hypothetical protein
MGATVVDDHEEVEVGVVVEPVLLDPGGAEPQHPDDVATGREVGAELVEPPQGRVGRSLGVCHGRRPLAQVDVSARAAGLPRSRRAAA